jgi:lipopolysaccharide transport system ATP-binding protein
MQARLSYAIAANLRPDLMLVDEVLAVGDIDFQRKCVRHMQQYLDGGGSLLLVSHNTYQIQSVCQRGLFLEKGRLRFSGTAVAAIQQMLERQIGEDAPAAAGGQAGPVAIGEVTIAAEGGGELRSGGPAAVTLHYQARARCDVFWGFAIWTDDQWVCITGVADTASTTLEPGAGQLACRVPRLPLVPGVYRLRTTILESATRQPLARDWDHNGGRRFRVFGDTDSMTNEKMAVQQLIDIDVRWT